MIVNHERRKEWGTKAAVPLHKRAMHRVTHCTAAALAAQQQQQHSSPADVRWFRVGAHRRATVLSREHYDSVITVCAQAYQKQ